MKPESDIDILMAFLNDELADDEVRSLTQRLHNEPELADRLLLLSREESVISEWARSMPAQVDDDEAKPMRIASWVKSAMAMAAVLALAALIMFAMQVDPSKKTNDVAVEPKPQGAIARVVNVFEPRSDDGLRELTTGQWLWPGDVKLAAGAAEIEFDRGAKVIMEAPCHLELKTADRVVLRFGKVAADVPSTAIGFTIDTADLEIIDHGTRFGVAVTRSNEVEIHVFEGHVEARERSDNQSRPNAKHLLAGDAIRSVGHDDEIETLRLAPQRFVREISEAMTQRGSLYWIGSNKAVVGGRLADAQFGQFWQGNTDMLRGLAFDPRSGDIFVADSISDEATEPGQILRVRADGTSENVIETGAGIFNLLLIGDRLYWPERETGRIMSCHRDGTDLTVLVSDVGHPSGLALDISTGHLYWTDWEEGAIWRSDLDGRGSARLVDGLTNPKSLTIDTARQRMYWVDGEHLKGQIKLKRTDLNGQRPVDLVVARNIGAIAIAPQRGTIYIGGLGNRVVRFDEDRWDGQTTDVSDLIDQETITPIFTTPGSHRVIYVPEH